MDRPPDDEQNLLRRMAQGDTQALHGLVERYADALFALAYSLTGNAADAEDLVQETFLAALRGLRGFQGRSTVKTWLYRILVRQVARHHRLRYRKPTVSLDNAAEPTATNALEANDIQLDLAAVLQNLSPEHQQVVVLRELQGLSYAEIADVLDIPQGTVESRLYRARAALREHLKDYLD